MEPKLPYFLAFSVTPEKIQACDYLWPGVPPWITDGSAVGLFGASDLHRLKEWGFKDEQVHWYENDDYQKSLQNLWLNQKLDLNLWNCLRKDILPEYIKTPALNPPWRPRQELANAAKDFRDGDISYFYGDFCVTPKGSDYYSLLEKCVNFKCFSNTGFSLHITLSTNRRKGHDIESIRATVLEYLEHLDPDYITEKADYAVEYWQGVYGDEYTNPFAHTIALLSLYFPKRVTGKCVYYRSASLDQKTTMQAFRIDVWPEWYGLEFDPVKVIDENPCSSSMKECQRSILDGTIDKINWKKRYQITRPSETFTTTQRNTQVI